MGVRGGRHRAPTLVHPGRRLIFAVVWLAATAGLMAAALGEAYRHDDLFWTWLFGFLLSSTVILYGATAHDCIRWYVPPLYAPDVDEHVDGFVDCGRDDERWHYDHDPGEP